MTETLFLQPNEQLTDIRGSLGGLSFPPPETFIWADLLGFVLSPESPDVQQPDQDPNQISQVQANSPVPVVPRAFWKCSTHC